MKRFAFIATLFAALLVSGVSAQAHEGHDHGVTKHLVSWVEIPVLDMDRATAFYSTILAVEMKREKQTDYEMAFFPMTNHETVTGALVKMDGVQPGAHGPVLYLNGGADLQMILDRVVPAGGTILIPKKKISDEIGYFAIFLDSEGNRLGLFSSK